VAKEWIAVLRAADAAARWHVHQRRKGAAEEPYVNHLLEVAMLVAEATDGKDPELVIAAMLHDAIGDQEVPRTMIAESFGEDVARLVEEVTDDKSLEKQERKRRQVEHAPEKSYRAKILKLADKTSNLRAIAASPPPDWSVKRRLEYVEWARKVAKGLTGVSEWAGTGIRSSRKRSSAVGPRDGALLVERHLSDAERFPAAGLGDRIVQVERSPPV
jgi:GTP diphosphokinase / guanosine-3',5'-bis(diphosphate) 3'-diphosphatase